MQTPNLKSPSKINDNLKSQYEKNNQSTLVYVLIGIIICLVLILLAIILSPSPSPIAEIEKNTINKNIQENVILDNKIKHIKNGEKNNFNDKIEIDWMLKKTDAENSGMPIWANESYNKALVYESNAKQFKFDEKNQQSEEFYSKAINEIDNTLLKKNEIFQDLLTNTKDNLNKNKLNNAKNYLKGAQSIDSENKELIRISERINNRNEVLNLIEQSFEKDKENKIEEAIESLNKALLLEPELETISEKLKQIKKKKNKIDFNNMISQVLDALDNNDLNSAKKLINSAKILDANEPIIEELDNRINEKNRIRNIQILQKKAMNQEKNELWKQAKISYQKILNIDPNVSQAVVAKERAKKYDQLNELINAIISKPERLQNDQIFEKSKKSIQYVKEELDNYKLNRYGTRNNIPKLLKKITSAEKMLKEASIIINLTIQSDNETNIVIYKVGQFGKIIEKIIQLRPGKYTIVGSRIGYRDYRKILVITANDQAHVINVQCREKI